MKRHQLWPRKTLGQTLMRPAAPCRPQPMPQTGATWWMALLWTPPATTPYTKVVDLSGNPPDPVTRSLIFSHSGNSVGVNSLCRNRPVQLLLLPVTQCTEHPKTRLPCQTFQSQPGLGSELRPFDFKRSSRSQLI